MIDPALHEETAQVDARLLRQFAGLWLVFWGGLAAWQLYQGRPTRAAVLGGLAVALGAVGLARPETIRPFFAALNAIARPIGAVMTRIVLGIAYYGLFTPLALVFRAMGRDPLFRQRRSGATTYWTARTGTQEPRRYFRQV
ncbi:MAG TPA: hypothetical protein VES67_02635 [Vicinamibacterales bacterium]|nr:hypothetical protein [Vicinamibacterales bacterium]